MLVIPKVHCWFISVAAKNEKITSRIHPNSDAILWKILSHIIVCSL